MFVPKSKPVFQWVISVPTGCETPPSMSTVRRCANTVLKKPMMRIEIIWLANKSFRFTVAPFD
jgi:hypothetical protein